MSQLLSTREQCMCILLTIEENDWKERDVVADEGGVDVVADEGGVDVVVDQGDVISFICTSSALYCTVIWSRSQTAY